MASNTQKHDTRHEPPLPKKDSNLSEWYVQVLKRSDMIDYYDVSGCYILKPNAYGIWENVKNNMDKKFKELGVKNCYFPIFIPEKFLSKENDHLEGFSPEVAWVTHAGQSQLNERIAIRPTSESGMYPYIKDWIRTHRDLPLQLNQWNNVVRWEFKQTVPFLRSREFLWQEGHSAFATKEEAHCEVYQILDIYESIYEDLLCVPVIKGTKTNGEKFAGADFTTTIEGFIPANGRGIQAATSHHLGQNFSKMFDIKFDSSDESRDYVHQNSWGFTTRSIGIMTLIHGDDRGMVIPPYVAHVQVVIVPINKKGVTENVMQACSSIKRVLEDSNIRVHFDDRDNMTPPQKFFYHELRGVPIRLEIGPKDLENATVMLVRRDNMKKCTVPIQSVVDVINSLFKQQQIDMYEKASKGMREKLRVVKNWSNFIDALNDKCLVVSPWCNDTECEEAIKLASKGNVEHENNNCSDSEKESKIREIAFNLWKKRGCPIGSPHVDWEKAEKIYTNKNSKSDEGLSAAAKSLCIPDENLAGENLPNECFYCGKEAKVWCLFGRSY